MAPIAELLASVQQVVSLGNSQASSVEALVTLPQLEAVSRVGAELSARRQEQLLKVAQNVAAVLVAPKAGNASAAAQQMGKATKASPG